MAEVTPSLLEGMPSYLAGLAERVCVCVCVCWRGVGGVGAGEKNTDEVLLVLIIWAFSGKLIMI